MRRKHIVTPWLLAILTASTLPLVGCATRSPASATPSLPSRFQLLEVGRTNQVYIAPGPGVSYGIATDNLGLLYLQGEVPDAN